MKPLHLVHPRVSNGTTRIATIGIGVVAIHAWIESLEFDVETLSDAIHGSRGPHAHWYRGPIRGKSSCSKDQFVCHIVHPGSDNMRKRAGIYTAFSTSMSSKGSCNDVATNVIAGVQTGQRLNHSKNRSYLPSFVEEASNILNGTITLPKTYV
jgi:hypothetical protein